MASWLGLPKPGMAGRTKRLCLAASQNHPTAALKLGEAYRHGLGSVEPDFIEAYKWYTMAAALGDRAAPNAMESLSAMLTSEQIAEAERLAREWRPGDCEGVVATEG